MVDPETNFGKLIALTQEGGPMSSSRKIDIDQLSFEHGLLLGRKPPIAVDWFAGGTFIKSTTLHQARFFLMPALCLARHRNSGFSPLF